MIDRSIPLLGGGDPVGMRRIDAEDLHLAREEGEFLERELDEPVLGVALDVGIELRRSEERRVGKECRL